MLLKVEKLNILSGVNSFLFAFAVLRMLAIAFSLMFLFMAAPLRAADRDDAANRIVSGIISFTYWPGLKHPPQLCVLPSARHFSLPATTGQPAADTAFSVVYLASEQELQTQQCDAIYFVNQSPEQQSGLLEKVSHRPVLALAENNPQCTLGAAFCLIFHPDKTVFSVNLDSLARSGVRVNPDVLLLSRKGSQ